MHPWALRLGFSAALSLGSAGGVDFRVVNDGPVSGPAVVGVSLPLPAGVLREPLPGTVRLDGRETAVQATVLTRWPDGSVRRAMVRFPVTVPRNAALAGVYPGLMPGGVGASAFERRGDLSGSFRVGSVDVRLAEDRASVFAPGTEQCLAEFVPEGPDLGEPAAPVWTVIEEGPFFLWLRCNRQGTRFCREVDIQVDSEGDLRLTHRLQSRLRGNEWTPDFGFAASLRGATSSATGVGPVRFSGREDHHAFADAPDLIVNATLADGAPAALAAPLALRQRRGTLEVRPVAETAGGGLRLALSRLEPVARENDGLMIQDGQWRVFEVLFSRCGAAELARKLDCPVGGAADWRAYDAVYHTGEPLRLGDPVIRELQETAILHLWRLSIDGDDWGNMTSYDPRTDTAGIDSMVRFNHCMYVWHDAFRGGDPRLRRIARDWSENYRNLSVYWGHETKYYGGSRRGRANRDRKELGAGPGTYMVRFDYALDYVTKGFHSFWLAYEETGDPRFREAAQVQAAWAMAHVPCNRGEMRNVGVIADFAKLHEYSGRPEYLEHALRLWNEFQSKQMPDLMFTQSGKPETGNELYIPNDDFGYRHPFYKPYITQYATNALPYLLALRPDDRRLRDTILACNRWMARAQGPAGGWGYPAPSTAGSGFSTEYCHGMMLAHGIAREDVFLEAVGRTLRTIVRLHARHGIIPSGLNPWERVQGRSDVLQTYRLAADRDAGKDLTHGEIRCASSPDFACYVLVLLRDYLRHRGEETLLASDPITEALLALPTTADAYRDRPLHPWATVRVTHEIAAEGMRLRFHARPVYSSPPIRCTWRFPGGPTAEGSEASWTAGRGGTHRGVLDVTRNGWTISREFAVTTPIGPGDVGRQRWPEGLRLQAESPSGQGGADTPVRLWLDRKGADGGAFSHWDAKGHWLEYRFIVDRPASFLFLAKYACPRDAAREVTLDEEPLGTLALPDSGGYGLSTRDDYGVALLSDRKGPIRTRLEAGEHVLRLTNTDGRGCNVDYFEWLPIE
ncbi:MAG: hypothetical protein JXR77_17330 [Lentisphaeria bacterium]|nr:hypothetical protein [Lentisphaeria bacterium]